MPTRRLCEGKKTIILVFLRNVPRETRIIPLFFIDQFVCCWAGIRGIEQPTFSDRPEAGFCSIRAIGKASRIRFHAPAWQRDAVLD